MNYSCLPLITGLALLEAAQSATLRSRLRDVSDEHEPTTLEEDLLFEENTISLLEQTASLL